MSAALIIPPIAAGRRRKDRFARTLLGIATVIALVPLVLVIFYLLKRGLGAISWHFFSTDPTGAFIGDPGGIKSALLGTLLLVGLASAIAIPIGIGVALYLVEYGKDGRFASVVRYFVDVMTGVPSIVFGLFVYIVLVIGGQFVPTGYAAWKGAVALALLMLPIVTRSAEVILLLVPNGLRESALALGAPRWRMILQVVLPTALAGMVTGILLAVARAAGETAPLLFTAAATHNTNFNLGQFMNSLPVQIYNDVTSPTPAVVERAWGAALALVTMIMLLNVAARLVAKRSRLT